MKFSLFHTIILSLGLSTVSFAGSATWLGGSPGNYWYNAGNWTPNTVPNGPSDTATFGVSNVTDVYAEETFPDKLEVNGIVFSPGASAYTIGPEFNPNAHKTLTVSGAGIINNSGITQKFVVTPIDFVGGGYANLMVFTNSATAGDLTQIAVDGTDGDDQFGGALQFLDSSTAGSSFITNFDGEFENGATEFHDSSSAGNARIINKASTAFRCGRVTFYDTATAGNATIVNQAQIGGNLGSSTSFFDSSDAGNSTIICNGGDEPATLSFGNDSTGGTARIMLFGTSVLDLEGHNAPGITLGSLEGEGSVSFAEAFFGGTNLTIGSNNLSTVFSGVISEVDLPGTVTKIGAGTLTLAGANAYTGGTIVIGGILLINNTSGSGTGTGPVQATAGTLGGSGTIAGAVTVGTGTGLGVILGPGARGVTPGTLTIRKKLTLNADATYRVTVDSRVSTADAVRAKGIRIQGASILFNDLGTNVLPAGTAFVIMSNAAAGPIAGQFANLADGSTVVIGNNTFQANYEGGDGNDLTLTVVP